MDAGKKNKAFHRLFCGLFIYADPAGLTGGLIFLLGVAIGAFTLINKFTSPSVPLGYSTLASIMALGFGITNISLGIIAEYLWRAYDAARDRPAFIISEIEDVSTDKE